MQRVLLCVPRSPCSPRLRFSHDLVAESGAGLSRCIYAKSIHSCCMLSVRIAPPCLGLLIKAFVALSSFGSSELGRLYYRAKANPCARTFFLVCFYYEAGILKGRSLSHYHAVVGMCANLLQTSWLAMHEILKTHKKPFIEPPNQGIIPVHRPKLLPRPSTPQSTAPISRNQNQ